MEYARKLYSFLGGHDSREADEPTTKNSPIRGGHRLWCGLQWSLIIFDLHTLVLD